MSVSKKISAAIAPLVICASVFAAEDQLGNTGTASGVETEIDTGQRQSTKTYASGERPGIALSQDTATADSERALFSGRGLSQREKRIFVLGLEAQEKK